MALSAKAVGIDVSDFVWGAIVGMICTADVPVPTTATRRPVKIDRLVRSLGGVQHLAGKVARPSNAGEWGPKPEMIGDLSADGEAVR